MAGGGVITGATGGAGGIFLITVFCVSEPSIGIKGGAVSGRFFLMIGLIGGTGLRCFEADDALPCLASPIGLPQQDKT